MLAAILSAPTLQRKGHVAHKKRSLTIIGVLLSLMLAACSPTAPASTPTVDMNPFRTEVASTVLAQVTQALALTPSVTPLLAPTATNLPSSTPSPTANPSLSATGTLLSGTPQATTDNHAQWVSQSIADDTTFKPGETFTMNWHLKNTGTSTWTANYILRYYSGNTFGAPKEITIEREVLPGDEIDINIPMTAPTTPGSYISNWVMSSENLSNFKDPVYLKIKVAAPATPTLTPKP
jgi:hypothetical protein